MQKKVNAILTIVKKVYKQCSGDFHEYYIQDLNSRITSSFMHNKSMLDFDKTKFSNFVDECIMYRLGINPVMPKTGNVIYDLSTNIAPELYTVSLDEVLSKLIYHAVPVELISHMKSLIESYDLDEKIVDHIISKLETNIRE